MHCVKKQIDPPQGAATGGGPRPMPVAATPRRVDLSITLWAGAEPAQGRVERQDQGYSPILVARLALGWLRSQRSTLPV